jgi:hypothetical protein
MLVIEAASYRGAVFFMPCGGGGSGFLVHDISHFRRSTYSARSRTSISWFVKANGLRGIV